jgi:hypothetical protein
MHTFHEIVVTAALLLICLDRFARHLFFSSMFENRAITAFMCSHDPRRRRSSL